GHPPHRRWSSRRALGCSSGRGLRSGVKERLAHVREHVSRVRVPPLVAREPRTMEDMAGARGHPVRSPAPEEQQREPGHCRAPCSRSHSAGLGRHVALSVMLTGIFVTIMDNSIVNVAIPSIRSTLGASFGEAELVIAAYAFTFAIGLITGGRLGDIFGQRRM